jgi:alanine racemase
VALRALARVNLAAIERNAALIRSRLGGSTVLCAVVKADGYGHGALPVARAALAGGAGALAVATAAEAAQLRAGGIEAPVLVMGALGDEELAVALGARAQLVAWTPEFVARVSAAAPRRGGAPVGLHVKLDTGMGRLGTRETGQALALARAIAADGRLQLAGAMTHLATADEPDPSFMREQLARFEPFAAQLRALAPGLRAHAANSAATLREPASHHEMVRCGIALYGLDPFGADAAAHGLEPALELGSWVAAVKLARPGESVGYGRRWVASRPTWIATLPIGYADGVPRSASGAAEALIGGRRFRLAGTVSMDNVTVELGPEALAEVGAPAVLIGRQGEEEVSAEQLARHAGTINYEIACRVSARVPRAYHRDGEPVGGER